MKTSSLHPVLGTVSSRCATCYLPYQGLSRTNPVFKYFQGLEFTQKNYRTFKDAWEPWLPGESRHSQLKVATRNER